MQRLVIVFIIALFFSACAQEDDYPIIPEISFLDYEVVENEQADSVKLTFSYLDGDGDLGLKQDETSLPGNPEIKNVIFVDYFERYSDPVFRRVIALGAEDSLIYPYNPPLLTPSGVKKAIRGEITISIDIYPLPLDTVKEIKYSIYMYDRQGHKSNVIESPIIKYSNKKP